MTRESILNGLVADETCGTSVIDVGGWKKSTQESKYTKHLACGDVTSGREGLLLKLEEDEQLRACEYSNNCEHTTGCCKTIQSKRATGKKEVADALCIERDTESQVERESDTNSLMRQIGSGVSRRETVGTCD